MAEKNETDSAVQAVATDIERINKQLDMFDQRLDNIDSMVSAVAERVMRRPISLTMICPHCGKGIEIAILGSERPKK